MTIISSSTVPILDSAGRPANGRVYIEQSNRYETAEGLVTTTRGWARVTNGVIQSQSGGQLEIPATPADQVVWFHEDFAGGTGVVRWATVIPDTAEVGYSELPETVPPGAGTGVPAWVSDVLAAVDDAEAASASAVSAAADAEAAKTAAEAVGTTNDTIIAGRINDTGSATRASLNATYGRVFNVSAPTGVAATDTANITAAINAANTAGGGVVRLQDGTYVLNAAPPALASGVALEGGGSAATRLHAPSWSGGLIRAVGSLASITANLTLAADATAGATSITVVSTTGLAVGDVLLLGDTLAVDSSNPTRHAGEFVKVSALTSTVITVQGTVRDTYTTARSAAVQVVTWVDGVSVSGLTIKNTAPSTNSGEAVRLDYCRNFTINDVAAVTIDGPAFDLRSCFGGSVSNVSTLDLVDDGTRFGYGVNIAGATEGATISGSRFIGGRHAVTTNGVDGRRGQPHDNLITGCYSKDSKMAAFDTHPAGVGTVFTACRVTGANGPGFQVRARDTQVIDCTVARVRDTGVYVGNAAAHGSTVRGCVIKHTGNHSIKVSAAANDLTITDNTISHPAFNALLVDSASVRGRFARNTVSFIGRTSQAQAVNITASGATGWVIDENLFINGTDSENGTTGQMRAMVGGLQTGQAVTIVNNRSVGATAALPFVEGTLDAATVNGNRALDVPTVQAKTGNYTLSVKDQVILASNTITLTLPSAVVATNGGRHIIRNTGAGTVTVGATAGNVDGSATASLAAGASATFISDGSNWWSA